MLRRNRPLCDNVHAVVTGGKIHNSTVTFREFGGGGGLCGHSGLLSMRSSKQWAGLLNSHRGTHYVDHQVRAVRFNDIAREHRLQEVDVFVLDVEGAEMSVLKHWSWDTVHVRVWAIENNKLDHAELGALMAAHGYKCDHQKVNSICGDREHAAPSVSRGGWG